MQTNHFRTTRLIHAQRQSLIAPIDASMPLLPGPLASGNRSSGDENKNSDNNGGRMANYGGTRAVCSSTSRIWPLFTAVSIVDAVFGSPSFIRQVGICHDTKLTDPVSVAETKALTDEDRLYSGTGNDHNDNLDLISRQQDANLLTHNSGFQSIDSRPYLGHHGANESLSAGSTRGSFWHPRTHQPRLNGCASQELPRIILRHPLSCSAQRSVTWLPQTRKTILRTTTPERTCPWKNCASDQRLSMRTNTLLGETSSRMLMLPSAVFPSSSESRSSVKDTTGRMDDCSRSTCLAFRFRSLKFSPLRSSRLVKRGHL